MAADPEPRSSPDATVQSRASQRRLSIPAICRFPDGSTRTLAVLELSLAGAWVSAMRPPQVGTVLTIELQPDDAPPITDLRGLVRSARVDPSDARSTGFEVLFLDVSDAALDSLSWMLRGRRRKQPAPRRERRRAPRIPVDLEAVLELDAARIRVCVCDTSISGALLKCDDPSLIVPSLLQQRCTLVIVHPASAAEIRLKAEIVRVAPSKRQVALKLDGLDVASADRMERLMIEALTDR